MGCSHSDTYAEWEEKMLRHEANVLDFNGLEDSCKIKKSFIEVEMDGAP